MKTGGGGGRAAFERCVGEVVVLVAGTPLYGDMFLRDIVPRVAVPLAVRQFALRRTEDGLLVGYRSWAMVTEAWAGRLRVDADAVNAMGRGGRGDELCWGVLVFLGGVG